MSTTSRLLLAVGGLSILGQVALIRELSVAFFGGELVIVLSLGVWLLGSGLGSLAARWWRPSPRALPILLGVCGLTMVAALLWARGARPLLSGLPGAYLEFPAQLLVMVTVLTPPAAMAGLAFPWAARLHVDKGGRVGGAYALECLGGAGGGILATVLPTLGAPNLAAILVCALLGAASAWTVPPRLQRSPAAATVALAALLVAMVGTSRIGYLDHALTGWTHPGLETVRDTPYGRVAVSGREGQFSVFDDDALTFETEGTLAEEFVHPAALQHPRPRSALILGGAGQGLGDLLHRHVDGRIVQVALDGDRSSLLADVLPGGGGAPIISADPRSYLATHGGWDLILAALPEPSSIRNNRYYTCEFFALCADALAPGGVLAFRLPSAENLWSEPVAWRIASIRRSVAAALPHVLILPGAVNVVICARDPLIRDHNLLAERYRSRRIESRLVGPAYLRYLLTNDRLQELETRLAVTPAPLNTDERPVCFRYATALWLSRFFPALGFVDGDPLAASLPAAAAVLTAILLAATILSHRRARPRAILLAGTAGFLGMTWESVLIVRYQAAGSALYRDLGLLLTLFMVGMSVGAAAGAGMRRLNPGATAALGLLFAAALAAALASGRPSGLAGTAVWLTAAGATTAALFVCAAGTPSRPGAVSLAVVYGADLAGGCLGALLVGLWLIPVAGLTGTALAAVVVALAAAACVGGNR